MKGNFGLGGGSARACGHGSWLRVGWNQVQLAFSGGCRSLMSLVCQCIPMWSVQCGAIEEPLCSVQWGRIEKAKAALGSGHGLLVLTGHCGCLAIADKVHGLSGAVFLPLGLR